MLAITDTLLGITEQKPGGGLQTSRNLQVDEEFVTFSAVSGLPNIYTTLNYPGTQKVSPELRYNISVDTSNTQIELVFSASSTAKGTLLLGLDQVIHETTKTIGAFVDIEKGLYGIASIEDGHKQILVHSRLASRVGIKTLQLRLVGNKLLCTVQHSDGTDQNVVTHTIRKVSHLLPALVIKGTNVLSGYTVRGVSAQGLTGKKDNPKSVSVSDSNRIEEPPETNSPLSARIELFSEVAYEDTKLADIGNHTLGLQWVVLHAVADVINGVYLSDGTAELVIVDSTGQQSNHNFTYSNKTKKYHVALPAELTQDNVQEAFVSFWCGSKFASWRIKNG